MVVRTFVCICLVHCVAQTVMVSHIENRTIVVCSLLGDTKHYAERSMDVDVGCYNAYYYTLCNKIKIAMQFCDHRKNDYMR